MTDKTTVDRAAAIIADVFRPLVKGYADALGHGPEAECRHPRRLSIAGRGPRQLSSQPRAATPSAQQPH